MIRRLRYVLVPMLCAISVSAFADPHLTQAQCHAYPFVPLHHKVTHAELMQELGELTALGYQPYADEAEYPSDIQTAEQKLNAEYQRDCLP